METERIITRVVHRLFGRPIIQNSFRGEVAEEIVAIALEPDWSICGGDWASCDLMRVSDKLRMQVKQSAARQSWHSDQSPKPRPSFSISHKTGRYEGALWIDEPGRNADIFVFGWHPVASEEADHRDPQQWLFYVVAERELPQQKSISLSMLSRLVGPVQFGALKSKVDEVAEGLAVTE